MIQSLFLLSPTGEVLIERHFRGKVTSRSVCDDFWQEASVSLNHHGGLSMMSTADSFPLYDTVPPILQVVDDTSHELVFLCSILRDGLSYLAVCPKEVSPLLILEFLGRVADIFQQYFGNPADESAIKDNFSTVYQLLEEMMDHGWPLTTEPNALQTMILHPTNIMSKLTSVIAGNSTTTANSIGTISNMPWRCAGVRHRNNEIYIDIIEEVDAVLDVTGRVLSWDVSGSIHAQSKLSGVPDLLLTFDDPKIMDDCSFHPCVRYGRYEMDHSLSFVPPDGDFQLMRYRIHPNILNLGFSPPILCTPQLHYESTTSDTTSNSTTTNNNTTTTTTTSSNTDIRGSITVHVSTRPTNSLKYSSGSNKMELEDVSITIPFPKAVKTTSNLQVTSGKVIYDEVGKVAKWILPSKLDSSKQPQLTGQMMLSELPQEATPPLYVTWKIPLASVSGLSVSGLSLSGESYKPYKGVRNITKSGRFQVRSN